MFVVCCRNAHFQVCHGLIESFGPEVFMVMKSTKQSPENICGFMFGEACDNPVRYNTELLTCCNGIMSVLGESHARVELLHASSKQ